MNIPKALRKIADNNDPMTSATSLFYQLADELELQQKDEDERDEKLRIELSDLLDPNQ